MAASSGTANKCCIRFMCGSRIGQAKPQHLPWTVDCQSPSFPALRHTGAASHASPAAEDGRILWRVVEKVEDGSHHSLLAGAEPREWLEAHRVALRRMVIDGVRPAMAFITRSSGTQGRTA